MVRLACDRPDKVTAPFREVWTQHALAEALRVETGILRYGSFDTPGAWLSRSRPSSATGTPVLRSRAVQLSASERRAGRASHARAS